MRTSAEPGDGGGALAVPGDGFAVARQPIFDRENHLIGYELLFRDRHADADARFDDGDTATSRVLLRTLDHELIQQAVGEGLAFVNLTRDYLLGRYPVPDTPSHLVLEILEDIEPDDAVLAGLRRLSAAGYTIALDDFEFAGRRAELLELADIVKIDVMALDQETLRAHCERLHGRGLRLLAEKIEDADTLARCRALGFDYYQGYYLGRPEPLKPGRRTAPPR